MWLTAPNRIGVAGWQSGQSVWMVKARGGAEGIELLFGNSSLLVASTNELPLPVLDEQFVRGDELHLYFPQPSEGFDFGFRLVIRPVSGQDFETTEDRAFFELMISVQTSLLDLHPTLDLLIPSAEHSESNELTGKTGEIHFGRSPNESAAVILGPQDGPYASAVDEVSDGASSPGHGLGIRLFGEFLEKGVIRRARPWLVLDRSTGSLEESELGDVWRELKESPVPLD